MSKNNDNYSICQIVIFLMIAQQKPGNLNKAGLILKERNYPPEIR